MVSAGTAVAYSAAAAALRAGSAWIAVLHRAGTRAGREPGGNTGRRPGQQPDQLLPRSA